MKCTKKILCALLAVLMCLSTFGFAASAVKAGELNVGDTFAFGMYPTSLVTDHDLVTKLNSMKQNNQGEVILGSETFKAVKPGLAENYKDLYDKKDYENYLIGVLYAEYKEYLEAYGYTIESTYWFLYEPIEWRVLSKDATGVLLMTEDVVDASAYNFYLDIAHQKDVSWKNSDIREWLNKTFYNMAFSDSEKDFILTSNVKNADNPVMSIANGVGTSGTNYWYRKGIAGEDTTDRLFLPSFEDITNRNYGFNTTWSTVPGDLGEDTGYYMEDEARQAYSTDYAKSHGVWSVLDNGDELKGICRYWLRTPGMNVYYNSAVLEDGRVSAGGFQSNHLILGIRPMMRVSPDAFQNAIRLSAPDGTIRYKQKGVHIDSSVPVHWTSDHPEIADIDDDGNVTIYDVGTVVFTATYETEDGVSTSTCTLEITYTWWQQAIRYFLFGWIWY